MLGKNKIVVLFLCILSLTVVLFTLPVLASPPVPQDQIVTQGQARYYDSEGDVVTTTPVLGDNSVVSVSKTIAETGVENEFDLTLTVKTSVDFTTVMVSSDAAVVLVLDTSGSMGGINDDHINYMPALRESAQNFVSSLADQAGDSARYVALVTFNTEAKIVLGWTDITIPANKNAVNQQIQNLTAGGATNVQGGLQMARNLLREEALFDLPPGSGDNVIENRAVVLFSDGEANKYNNLTENAAYAQATTVNGLQGDSSLVFNPAAAAATEAMAQVVKDETSFQTAPALTYQKYTAYLYTIAFGSAAPTEWLSDTVATNPTYAYEATNASELHDVFAAIAKRIEDWAEAWTVTDPMGANIEFLSTLPPAKEASGELSFQNDLLTWDLKKATPDSFVDNIYTYQYVYRVGLDTTAATFSPATAYPTNGTTELTYVMVEEDVIVSGVMVAEFAVPAVKGFAGGSGSDDALAFIKVGDGTVPLPGCVFTLTNQDKPGHTLTTTAAAGTGLVAFAVIPSGYTYTLEETFMPADYDGKYLQSGETYTVTVSFGEVSMTDSLGTPVDLDDFEFNNPPVPLIGKTVTGLVWPLAVEDLGVGPKFLDLHAVTVELRSSFLSPATGHLSTKAVLKDADGLGSFTFEHVEPGDYVLHISSPGFLTRAMLVTIADTDPAVVALAPPAPRRAEFDEPSDLLDPYGSQDGPRAFKLWWGDCNDDLSIDAKDVMIILALIPLDIDAFDDSYYEAPSLGFCADLNRDGRIDSVDLAMAYAMWDRIILDYPGADDVDIFN